MDNIEWIENNISSTKIIKFPYPHRIYTKFFPDKMYDTILNHDLQIVIDEKKDWRYIAHSRRYQCDIYETSTFFNKLSKDFQDFVKWVYNYRSWCNYNIDYLKHLSKLRGYTKKDFKQMFLDKEHGGKLQIYIDSEDYTIVPHTDSSHKITTTLVPLVQDNSLENNGTSLFSPIKDVDEIFKNASPEMYAKRNQSSSWIDEPYFKCNEDDNIIFSDDGYKVHKTTKFLPNTAFEFLVHNNSFHGTYPCKLNGQQRITMMWTTGFKSCNKFCAHIKSIK